MSGNKKESERNKGRPESGTGKSEISFSLVMDERKNSGPRILRKSIKKDRVHPFDFLNRGMVYCCEQCSYFDHSNESCVFGFLTKPHLRREQLKTFELTGHMAFCRFLEID